MKYALIGCGRISPNHLEAAINNNLEIVGICDIVPENMDNLLNKLNIELDKYKKYTDYKEMLENEKPELVAIATESGKHAQIALDCLDMGCNLIIEKPIALSLEDADKIIVLNEGKIDGIGTSEELLKTKSPKGKLAFVGDGINDAPVLTRADIGIAMGALGSDAAIEAADVVIMDDDISKISTAISLSQRTIGIVKQNIYFAIGIKVFFLLLGALGLANMMEAVFADVGVSIIAILNSMRTLKKKKKKR